MRSFDKFCFWRPSRPSRPSRPLACQVAEMGSLWSLLSVDCTVAASSSRAPWEASGRIFRGTSQWGAENPNWACFHFKIFQNNSNTVNCLQMHQVDPSRSKSQAWEWRQWSSFLLKITAYKIASQISLWFCDSLCLIDFCRSLPFRPSKLLCHAGLPKAESSPPRASGIPSDAGTTASRQICMDVLTQHHSSWHGSTWLNRTQQLLRPSSAPSQLSALLGDERDVVEKELTLVVDNLK